MSLRLVSILSAVFLSVFLTIPAYTQACRQVRSSFDIGSSDTKVLSAVIDVCNKTVEKVLVKERTRLDFKGDLLRSSSKKFSKEFLNDAVAKILSMKKSAEAKIFQFCASDQEKCAADPTFHAVLTSAFRQAENSKELIDRLKHEGNMDAEVITQQREGFLGYLSALIVARKQLPSGVTPLVIDIGGGSMQWSFVDDSKQFQTFGIEFGAKKVLKYVVEDLKGKSIQKLSDKEIAALIYPLSAREIELVELFITKQLENVPGIFIEKARTSPVVGVGGVLGIAAPKLVGKYDPNFSIDQRNLPSPIDLKELTSGIRRFAPMSLAEVKETDKDFPESFVTNAVMTKVIANKLGVQKIQALTVDLTVGEMFARDEK